MPSQCPNRDPTTIRNPAPSSTSPTPDPAIMSRMTCRVSTKLSPTMVRIISTLAMDSATCITLLTGPNLVFCNVWGPAHVTSSDAHNYFLFCADQYSNFMWFFTLKLKSNVFPTFKRFLAMAKRQFKTKLKIVQTNWVESFGISLKFSHPLAFFIAYPFHTQVNKTNSLNDDTDILSKPA
ncbi:hypothetical protein LXL04_028487 [Taraxacum kok-saghyz]